jgi:hypothetical protein
MRDTDATDVKAKSIGRWYRRLLKGDWGCSPAPRGGQKFLPVAARHDRIGDENLL